MATIVIDAMGKIDVKVPVVVRLEGTNAEAASKLFDEDDKVIFQYLVIDYFLRKVDFLGQYISKFVLQIKKY